MRALAMERWDLRPLAQELWPELSRNRTWSWDGALERLLLGEGPAIRPPAAVADVLAAFAELGLVRVSADRLEVATPRERRPFADEPRAARAAARLTAELAYLDMAATLELFPPESGYPEIPVATRSQPSHAAQRSTV
jgi:hypothetical protein